MKKLLFIFALALVAATAVLLLTTTREYLPAVQLQRTTNTQAQRVVQSARQQADYTLFYDPAYVVIDYPGGDVPRNRGVCTDVVIRAFRAAGVDLQRNVHEDMAQHFTAYPKKWGLSRPDANIDHRRVPNLMTFFERHNADLAITEQAQSYIPGDVVAWRLGNGRLHIGIVTDSIPSNRQTYLVAHNIGSGVQVEDVLFRWAIIGHYRYFRGTAQ